MKNNDQNLSNKHIFFFFSDLGLGGVQRKIVDTVNVLKNKKYKLIIPHIILRYDSQFKFEKEISNSRCHIHISTIYRRSYYTLYIIYLFLRYRPDSVLAYFPRSLLYALIGKFFSFSRNTIIVLSQDNILSMENREGYLEKPFPKWVIHLLCKFPRHIIVQTKYAKEDLVNTYKVSKNKISIIPNWFIGKIPKHSSKPIDCIYCGRFAKQKRLDKLIQVFSIVKKSLPEFHALLIGEGDEKEIVQKQILHYKLQKNVRMLPPTHTARQYIAKSKLFLLTSEFEGHPMVLLEAMAAETVPIVIDYPAVSEYLIDRKTGFIEPNLKSMANQIIRLLKNKKERGMIAKHGKTDVQKRYNQELLSQTLSLL